MGSFSILHWLIVFAIVMLVFGTGKLRNLGSDLGGAVRGFKDSVKDGGSAEPADPAGAAHRVSGRLIERETADRSQSASAK